MNRKDFIIRSLTIQTAGLSRLFTAVTLFWSLQSSAGPQCHTYFKSENFVVQITAKKGSGMQSTHESLSTRSQQPLIWLKKVKNWLMHWNSVDLAGDSRWGVKLLGKHAAHFGFEKMKLGVDELYAVPSPQHANWAIRKFNQELVERGQTHELIPLRLEFSQGIKSNEEFLKDFVEGLIPVGTSESRIYLHDLNYHYMTAILLRPEIIKTWQRRTSLALRLHRELKNRFSHDPIIQESAEKLLTAMAERVDQTGNVAPFVEEAYDKMPTAFLYAEQLRSQLVSHSDTLFFKDLIDEVARTLPFVTHYTYRKEISSEREQEIIKNYPLTENLGRYFTDRIHQTQRDMGNSWTPLENDPSAHTMMDSLDHYLKMQNPQVLKSWLRWVPEL